MHGFARFQNDAPPRVIFIEELSELIGKAPTTIRTCATNAKYLHLIPRPFKMPNSRRLCWWESDVLAWINASQELPLPTARRPRGRPTKAQQVAWQRQAIESRSLPQGAR
jgi:predicted DNA-binding transcriptional regulator AlpA